MSWNYRVFKEANGDYIVREVFYDEDGSIISCTKNGVEPIGQSLEELTEDIEYYQAALTLPVLTLADIPKVAHTKRVRTQTNTISHEQLLQELGLTEKTAVPA